MSRWIVGPVALIIVTGCATTEPSPALLSAQSAVQTAEQNPLVIESAPEELERARRSLAAAQAVYEEDGNDEPARLEHQAYLAERYAQVAVARADAARLEGEIESADAQRNEVLLEAREAEAARAQELAAARAQQAVSARAEAVDAEQEAEDLQRRLEELQAEQTERGIVLTLGDVLFDVDGAELKPGADTTIAELAAFLEEYEERAVLVEGHTDSTGSSDYNQRLSEQRANAVKDELVADGIGPQRVHTRGIGEESPVASNDTVAGRQQNRRVEIVISDEQGRFPSMPTAQL